MPDPARRSSIRLLTDAFVDFARIEAASGTLLLAATVAALLWANSSWAQIFAASWLCGIGFTMSLFIAALSFKSGALLDTAKIAILGASVAAGIVGSLLLWALGKPAEEKALAGSAGA